ncbi:Glycosyltransferase involved in cell wall bisynthesis [Pustulibacterium marinum]|uniref:Glycosyltransferase involved in cell wall bisynthesis n=1 Tax=Pustulibacterium marinum TaxID=1224947 RepID=A0A1I7HND4_9FLAO|nr:glycosyltransferase family 4 protein [Pustulibacterium marinum]SFU62131.1 Glycosyltransferase involved in cell wall bisynthesis [Pustulibacterium marinum]
MKNLLYIGNKLSHSGVTVTTIETLGNKFQEEGFSVIYASSVKNKTLRMLHMVWVFLINQYKTDAILIDTYSTSNFYYAVVIGQLAKLFRKPYIPILHGGNLESRLKNNSKLAYPLFSKSLANVAPSLFLKSIFENYGYKNTVFIPNPIDVKEYSFLKREKTSLKLLWVRSFASLYNPLLAVKAVEELMKRGYNVELCMVGPQKDQSWDDCHAYTQKYSLPVKFTGKLTKSEWLSLSKQYDVFINTTTIDNTPLSVLEAMALGLPVISTNVGGIPFLIRHKKNGMLISSNDLEGLVNTLIELHENPDLVASLSNAGRAYVSSLDWSLAKKKWLALLQISNGNS